VLWPNPTTRLLQLFSVQRPSRATLDLGAGCGILGILAARFSEQVTATDLNPRAAEFALFNARLNGLESIECLTGDTFEPVAGRTFDLIVANPPFFVTPSSSQMFCENEMELDQYCRKVVREAPSHLNEGGFFQAVLEWVQVTGQSWQERLSEWLEGSGCDAWVLRSYIRDAAGYARERIRETSPDESLSTKMDAWMQYYRQHGVEEIHGGILAMRRRSGRNWLRLEGTPVEAQKPFGNLVLETFATQDILHDEPDDTALLGMRPRLPEGAELDQRFRMQGGAWAPLSLHILLTGAAPAQSAVEREVAGFLGRCDGARTLRELAEELAANAHVRVEDACAQCCKIVRTLASRRILQLTRESTSTAQNSPAQNA
jgi:methylase of polypeptide subunit release factors